MLNTIHRKENAPVAEILNGFLFGRGDLMEESATEGQQNSIQSKQCLVFSLHFALLSN